MEKVIVKIVRENDKIELPKYETSGAAGMDVRANITEPIVLGSLERTLVPTGLKIAIPEGDYRGELKVIIANMSKDSYTINPGERIGQLVLNKVEQIEWEVVETLDETERGAGGFGHTGK